MTLRLVQEGTVDGLRVDHVDGLRDPAAYLEWLRSRAPDAWIVVEKILRPGEALPQWPIDGTTGYDFLALAGARWSIPKASPSSKSRTVGSSVSITTTPTCACSPGGRRLSRRWTPTSNDSSRSSCGSAKGGAGGATSRGGATRGAGRDHHPVRAVPLVRAHRHPATDADRRLVDQAIDVTAARGSRRRRRSSRPLRSCSPAC